MQCGINDLFEFTIFRTTGKTEKDFIFTLTLYRFYST